MTMRTLNSLLKLFKRRKGWIYDINIIKNQLIINTLMNSLNSFSIKKRSVRLFNNFVIINNCTLVEKIYYIQQHKTCCKLIRSNRLKVKHLGVSVSDIYSKLNITERKDIAYKMSQEIDRIHMNGFIHNDICLRNFLYDIKTKAVNIIDFEFATYNKRSSIEVEMCIDAGITSHSYMLDVADRNTKKGDNIYLAISILSMFGITEFHIINNFIHQTDFNKSAVNIFIDDIDYIIKKHFKVDPYMFSPTITPTLSCFDSTVVLDH